MASTLQLPTHSLTFLSHTSLDMPSSKRTSTVLTAKNADAQVDAALKPHDHTNWSMDEDPRHIPRLRRAFERALERGTEYRLYNPYNYSLSRNALHTELPGPFFLSVFPQADFGTASTVHDDPDPEFIPAGSDNLNMVERQPGQLIQGRTSRYAPRNSRSEPHFISILLAH